MSSQRHSCHRHITVRAPAPQPQAEAVVSAIYGAILPAQLHHHPRRRLVFAVVAGAHQPLLQSSPPTARLQAPCLHPRLRLCKPSPIPRVPRLVACTRKAPGLCRASAMVRIRLCSRGVRRQTGPGRHRSDCGHGCMVVGRRVRMSILVCGSLWGLLAGLGKGMDA